jgi:purine-binding chemotaxis protein CheW
MSEKNVVSFRVGDQWYGLPVESIIEILHLVMLSEVPVSSPDVIGLLQLRNTVMPVVDLRLRFGITDPDYRINTPIIAAQTLQGPVGLVVDDVDNVEPITDDQLDSNLGQRFPYITGTAKVGNRLLLLVEPGSVK